MEHIILYVILSCNIVSLTEVGDGVGVDVSREPFLAPEVGDGDLVVGQLKTLHLPRLAGQLPEHLHGRPI